MANIVRKFQIAAVKGRLPTFGDEETAPEVDRRLTREDVSSDALRGREDVERSPHGAGDDAMLEQIRGHVRSLDQRHGREYDEQSERISHSLLADRQSVDSGKGVAVRVETGGRRDMKKKIKRNNGTTRIG